MDETTDLTPVKNPDASARALRLKSILDGSAQLPSQHSNHLLLDAIKSHLPALTELLERANGKWESEDLIYRFWHQSFKVYYLQELTESIVTELGALTPEGASLNPWFLDIVNAGTGMKFEPSHNDDWPRHVRPIVDAFFHARFMLEMAVRYGHELETAPSLLPSGWAALLHLYQIR